MTNLTSGYGPETPLFWYTLTVKLSKNLILALQSLLSILKLYTIATYIDGIAVYKVAVNVCACMSSSRISATFTKTIPHTSFSNSHSSTGKADHLDCLVMRGVRHSYIVEHFTSFLLSFQ